ncbi:hypothetical protein [Streptomyces sp. NBC_00391]|uniref:hypothetical protein n=1 Tax=Streptomyces sp. NBC_00391 TaxID=2903647 RepID=UPI002E1FF424
MPDAVSLGVLDTGFFHGGFPEDALLACRFDLPETSAFGGFAAKGDLLCDLGELVFEGMAGGVGPFARPVRLAAAVDEAEAFHFTITAQGETVGFLVLQEPDRTEHFATEKELAEAKKHSWIRIPRFDYTPSGEMLCGGDEAGVRSRFPLPNRTALRFRQP